MIGPLSAAITRTLMPSRESSGFHSLPFYVKISFTKKHLVRYLAVLSFVGVTFSTFAQTNTFPASGPVGIGAVNAGYYLNIAGGPLEVTSNLNQFTLAGIDSATGRMPWSGIMSLYGGDTHIRNFWGVSIDINGGFAGDAVGAGYTRIPHTSSFTVNSRTSANTFATLFTVRTNGNVGIGTVNPQSLLAVAGTITGKVVTVTQTGWSDFVFDSSYHRLSLDKVDEFTRIHKHLPEVPSAQEIADKGLDLGAMQKLHMQKIEELTLYAIDADKRINRDETLLAELQAQLAATKDLLKSQQEEIELLKSKKKTSR